MVAPRKVSAVDKLSAGLNADARAVQGPDVHSFREFLEKVARVPVGGGEYGKYSFEGREALIEVVACIDRVLGSETGQPIKDAKLSLAGGAQFGKSILELNFIAYGTGCQWLNLGLYLPDADLVEGMVDTKFRPDVLDQLDWFAAMTKVGKAVNKSGKAVSRKGAFSVTDGVHKSQGMIIGLNKVPTSFTFDATTLDEVDDIKPKMMKFVRGRMTSSKLRFMLMVGTQRIAGRGMNKAWKDGSQGVQIHRCSCGHKQNLEESFPQCVRVAMDGKPNPSDPQFQLTADFRHDPRGEVVAIHEPKNHYYVACTECGLELDRGIEGFAWVHRRPEQIVQENWSFRISQLGIAAIDLSQIVAHWTRAVADPEEMVSFRCDRLGLPESTEQKITPIILDRARTVEVYDLHHSRADGAKLYGGLDTGRRCWLFARESIAADRKRVYAAEQIAVGNMVSRALDFFSVHGLECLCIDIAPETDAARTIALRLNGLAELTQWPVVPEKSGFVSFPGGLRWNGNRQRWENCRCFVVEFTKKSIGAGISHGFDQFEKGGHKMFVPKIACNRFETIDRVVREFLTPAENVADVIQDAAGKPFVRTQPAMRLPRRGQGSPVILDVLDNHLLAGSEREESAGGEVGDYVDKTENHLILADGYSALAEMEGGAGKATKVAASRISRTNEHGEPRTGRKWAAI